MSPLRPAVLIIAVFGLSALAALARPARALAAGPEFTVCTITINSDDEKKVFQKHLSAKEFQFVELTELKYPDAAGDPAAGADTADEGSDYEHEWLSAACRKAREGKLSCDVLMISGHFAGTEFFSEGDGDLELKLSELEKHSCRKDCDGILKSPREVFLFGCNTLATRDPDSRTPEQYLAVLLQDGIRQADAERIVEARYGAAGESNKERMQRVFSSSPHLYGFHSVGPSGRTIRPFLENYLKGKKDYADHLARDAIISLTKGLDAVRKFNAGDNDDLARALSKTYFSQCSGAGVTGDAASEVMAQRLCLLADENVALNEKLEMVRGVMSGPEFLRYLYAFQEFFGDLPEPERFSPEERAALARIKESPTAKATLLQLVETIKTPELRIDLAKFAASFGWYDAETLAALVVSTHLRATADPNPRVRRTALSNLLPHFHGSREAKAAVLAGLADPDPDVRRELAQRVWRLNENSEIQKALIPLLIDPNEDIRASASAVLEQASLAPELLQKIRELAKSAQPSRKFWAVRLLTRKDITHPGSAALVVDLLSRQADEIGGEIVGSIPTTGELPHSVARALVPRLRTDGHAVQILAAFIGRELGRFDHPGDSREWYPLLEEIAALNPIPRDLLASMTAGLANVSPRDPARLEKLVRRILASSSMEPDPLARQLTADIQTQVIHGLVYAVIPQPEEGPPVPETVDLLQILDSHPAAHRGKNPEQYKPVHLEYLINMKHSEVPGLSRYIADVLRSPRCRKACQEKFSEIYSYFVVLDDPAEVLGAILQSPSLDSARLERIFSSLWDMPRGEEWRRTHQPALLKLDKESALRIAARLRKEHPELRDAEYWDKLETRLQALPN